MKIHISHSTKILLNEKNFNIVERGTITVKGKGEMKTYFVLSKMDSYGHAIRCPFQDIFDEYIRKNGDKKSIIDETNDKGKGGELVTKKNDRPSSSSSKKASNLSIETIHQSTNLSNNINKENFIQNYSQDRHLNSNENQVVNPIVEYPIRRRNSSLSSLEKPELSIVSPAFLDSNCFSKPEEDLLNDPTVKNYLSASRSSVDFRKQSITDFKQLDFSLEKSKQKIKCGGNKESADSALTTKPNKKSFIQSITCDIL